MKTLRRNQTHISIDKHKYSHSALRVNIDVETQHSSTAETRQLHIMNMGIAFLRRADNLPRPRECIRNSEQLHRQSVMGLGSKIS
jgi:hypothetical protein